MLQVFDPDRTIQVSDNSFMYIQQQNSNVKFFGLIPEGNSLPGTYTIKVSDSN